MADNLHTIQKQSFEVDFPSEKKAYEFQERFSKLVKGGISKVIETVFDRVNPEDAILRISKLEIDLGTVDLNNLEKEVVFKLERELLRALERKASMIKTQPVKGEDELVTTQKSLLEVFIFYLQSGTLPWWGRYIREHGVGIDQVFDLLLEKDTANTMREVIPELRTRSVRNRFIRQFKDEQLLRFVEVIYTSKSRLFKDSLEIITSVFNSLKITSPQVSRVPVRVIFWEYVIETYIAISPGASVEMHDKPFNDKLVSFIIYHPEVSQRELRSAVFATALKPEAKGTIVEKALKQALRKVEPARPEKEQVKELAKEDIKEWIGKWYEKVSKQQFEAFLQRELAADSQFVIQFIENAIRLFKTQGIIQSETTLLKAFYRYVVDYIYVEKKGKVGSLSKVDFLSFTADKIADHVKIEPARAVEVLSETYEDVTEKPRKRTYTQQEIIRFFLLFGALPAQTKIRRFEDLTAIIMQLEPASVREIISNLDPLILPLVAKRVRYQFEDNIAESIFKASPELRLAEIVEESFESPLETTLSRLSEQQGRLYGQLKQLMESGEKDLPEEVQKILTEAVAEAEALGFIRQGKFPASATGTEPALGLDVQTRSRLVAGIYQLLKEKPGVFADTVKKAVQEEEIRTLWIKHLPDDLLMRIAHVIAPAAIEERVQWVDLLIAREIKEKSYRVTQMELRQLEWKHILASTTEEIKRLVSLQEESMDETRRKERAEAQEERERIDGKEAAEEESKAASADKAVKEEEERKREEQKKVKEEEERKKMEKERLEREKQEKLAKRLGREPIYINNAGLVILHPFLSRLFNMLELLENKKFKDTASAHKAVHILQYIAYKDDKTQEFELALNKVLCGLDIFEPLDNAYALEDKEKELCESLVNGVIQNWPTLGKTSPDNFRVSFLHREGRLEQAMNGGWQLYVEQKAWDVLMDTLPWSVSMVILPWMEKTLAVEWR
ncbi:hypothetical protein GCM10009122_53590 [Fulvivirga kasyanovii]|uniref:Uncharacterized protein n=1 Tax=Fulvivirga kasyanovii TaxID=396812 RepID=A0ABW9RXG0_9BACT|nr:contractile injection system tape measure protein [Fulvivirga kasyanovii]MTI27690.1 hypothetical protein [Fulvivirga kasyanovii]